MHFKKGKYRKKKENNGTSITRTREEKLEARAKGFKETLRRNSEHLRGAVDVPASH